MNVFFPLYELSGDSSEAEAHKNVTDETAGL